MKEWANANNNQPKWTTETKLKMIGIYKLLEERVEKNSLLFIILLINYRLMRVDHVEPSLDFDTEFTNLTSSMLPFFAPHSLTVMDIQQEFECCVKDEELGEMIDDMKKEDDQDDKEDKEDKDEQDDEDMAVITTIEEDPSTTHEENGEHKEHTEPEKREEQPKHQPKVKTPLQSPIKIRITPPKQKTTISTSNLLV